GLRRVSREVCSLCSSLGTAWELISIRLSVLAIDVPPTCGRIGWPTGRPSSHGGAFSPGGSIPASWAPAQRFVEKRWLGNHLRRAAVGAHPPQAEPKDLADLSVA